MGLRRLRLPRFDQMLDAGYARGTALLFLFFHVFLKLPEAIRPRQLR